MLVTVNPVIEVVEHRLHGSGELHVKIEVIGRKGNDEKCGTGKRQFFYDGAKLGYFTFSPLNYHDSSSGRTSSVGSTGSSPMTVRIYVFIWSRTP